jgi:hypothetical protein
VLDVDQEGTIRMGAHSGKEPHLTVGNIYEAELERFDSFRIWDDSGEDYIYPRGRFELV